MTAWLTMAVILCKEKGAQADIPLYQDSMVFKFDGPDYLVPKGYLGPENINNIETLNFENKSLPPYTGLAIAAKYPDFTPFYPLSEKDKSYLSEANRIDIWFRVMSVEAPFLWSYQASPIRTQKAFNEFVVRNLKNSVKNESDEFSAIGLSGYIRKNSNWYYKKNNQGEVSHLLICDQDKDGWCRLSFLDKEDDLAYEIRLSKLLVPNWIDIKGKSIELIQSFRLEEINE